MRKNYPQEEQVFIKFIVLYLDFCSLDFVSFSGRYTFLNTCHLFSCSASTKIRK